jgi:hypothetical protein
MSVMNFARWIREIIVRNWRALFMEKFRIQLVTVRIRLWFAYSGALAHRFRG